MERQCTLCPVDKEFPCFKEEIDAIASADIAPSVKNENIGLLRKIYRPKNCNHINHNPPFDKKGL